MYAWRPCEENETTLLSNNTISGRIRDTSDDVEVTVIGRIRNSKFFAIQLDQSIDVAYFAVLLVARYCTGR